MENCIITELEDGEFNGLDLIEIYEIPDISILVKNSIEEKEYIQRHKKAVETLLNEIYFACKQYFNLAYQNQDYSLELAFVSEEVKNQTYRANVKIYFLIRGISSEQYELISRMKELKNIVITSLSESKYKIKEIDDKEKVLNQIKEIACKDKKILIKEGKVENLQSAYIPQCFTFEKLPRKNHNFTKLITTLMQYPNSAIMIDLIPTILTSDEIENLERYSNMLDMINRGVMGAEGNISNVLASKPSEMYRYYEQNKYGAIFAYNILICADSPIISTITTKISGEIGIGESAYTNLKMLEITNDELDVVEYFNSLPWVINEIMMDKRLENPIYTENPLGRMPFIVTGEEASEVFQLPYGDYDLTAGINISKADQGNKQYNKKIINNGDIMVGTLKSSTNGDQIGFSLGDITKHMLIVGTPGSGKTTFSVSLLDRLWKDHHIPFLVIEPAKNEYRAMIDSIPDIQVFTPGKDFISP